MPPSTASGGSSKRSKPIIPAIPLSLTKPKPKPNPNPSSVDSSAKQEDVSKGVTDADHADDVNTSSTTNGDARYATTGSSAFGTPVSQDSGIESGPASARAVKESNINSNMNNTPLDRTASTPTTSTTSSRPPTNRSGVRSIRTELPPAFVPSAGQQTPQSATSSSQSRPSAMMPRGHAVRASASSIVFGGLESQHSSPAPAPSVGSAYEPPQVHHPPPSAMLDGTPSEGGAVSNTHGENPGPAGFTPYPSQFPVPQPQGPSQHPPFNHESYRPPQQYYADGDFYGNGARHQSNGHLADSPSTSMGWDPARPDSYEPKTMVPGQLPFRPSHYGPPVPAQSQYSHPDVTARLENAEALRDYLQSQFANPSLADCQLRISEGHEGPVQTFDGHGIMLSRSPTLFSLIQGRRQESVDSRLSVPIHLYGRYISLRAFMDALRYIYGGPVLPLEQISSNSPSEQMAATNARMEAALQHMAVGAWLKLPAFASRGLDVASQFLRWDNIDMALRFALEGGLSHIWNVADGSEEKPGNEYEPSAAGQSSSPAYDPFSTNLLQRIMVFTINNFPPTFYLDTTAPELPSCPRLPPLPPPSTTPTTNGTAPTINHQSRPSRSGNDPRLSQIRFGEVDLSQNQQQDQHPHAQHHQRLSSETNNINGSLPPQRPSFPTTATSSILLSLPFPLLKCILEHYDLANRLGPDTVASIMRQVVAERDARRLKVVHARQQERNGGGAGSGVEGGMASQLLMGALNWEEFVQLAQGYRAGSRVARRWVAACEGDGGGGEEMGSVANGFGAAAGHA